MNKATDQLFNKELVEKITKICFKTVRDRIGNTLDIQQEVTSETLTRIWEHRDNIDFASGKFWGYVKTISINCFLDLCRKNKSNQTKQEYLRSRQNLWEDYERQFANYDLIIEELKSSISDPIDKEILEKKLEGYDTAKEIMPFLEKFGIQDTSAVSKRLKKLKEHTKKFIYKGE